MRKEDFIEKNRDYISSLICSADEKLSKREWRLFIELDCKEYEEQFDDVEIKWIIEALEDGGVVDMRYYIIDVKGCDMFEEELETKNKEDAIKYAKSVWEHLTAFDQGKREAFYLVNDDGTFFMDIKEG